MADCILYGNGISLLSPNCPSWNGLLEKIDPNCPSEFLNEEKIPNTFKYEMLLPNREFNNWQLSSSTIGRKPIIGKEHIEYSKKKSMGREMAKLEINAIYERLAKLKIYHFLTPNYDYLLENTFKKLYGIEFNSDCQEGLYSVTRKQKSKFKNRNINIWHMHGEIDFPKTIMLGLDHYVGILSRVEQYVKGTKVYKNQKPRSIEEKINENKWGTRQTWVDMFFTENIHIVGFGLDYSEIDIWWLLNRRKRLYKNYVNEIHFYGEVKPHTKYLFDMFDIKYHEVKVENGDYLTQYNTIIDLIEGKVGKR